LKHYEKEKRTASTLFGKKVAKEYDPDYEPKYDYVLPKGAKGGALNFNLIGETILAKRLVT